jgi:hypothetical protein
MQKVNLIRSFFYAATFKITTCVCVVGYEALLSPGVLSKVNTDDRCQYLQAHHTARMAAAIIIILPDCSYRASHKTLPFFLNITDERWPLQFAIHLHDRL